MNVFSADDDKSFEQWLSDFEDMSKLCAWSDIQKVIYAKRLLRGSARMFVYFAKCGATWGKLRAALETEFSRKINSNKNP